MMQPPPRPGMVTQPPSPPPPGRPPIVRGNDSSPAPAPVPKPAPLPPLRLPTPEALGIAVARTDAVVDWGEVRGRIERIGAVGFHFEKKAGLFRVTCLMPTAIPDRPHPITSEADSEGEAVRLAFTRVDDWLRGR